MTKHARFSYHTVYCENWRSKASFNFHDKPLYEKMVINFGMRDTAFSYLKFFNDLVLPTFIHFYSKLSIHPDMKLLLYILYTGYIPQIMS